ncbi:hypothetical protein EV207_11488 [Scopulibacillus darangshiensis]|uniref:Uncharacterized protein n=2 Tax=Scopulibacillus darangshiensis TaxID=442528 RepID=A0A4R2P2L6_9BACL|nr:hypothetical protein EV207_11488 [Scopulibacillus darangshiensis]
MLWGILTFIIVLEVILIAVPAYVEINSNKSLKYRKTWFICVAIIALMIGTLLARVT